MAAYRSAEYTTQLTDLMRLMDLSSHGGENNVFGVDLTVVSTETEAAVVENLDGRLQRVVQNLQSDSQLKLLGGGAVAEEHEHTSRHRCCFLGQMKLAIPLLVRQWVLESKRGGKRKPSELDLKACVDERRRCEDGVQLCENEKQG